MESVTKLCLKAMTRLNQTQSKLLNTICQNFGSVLANFYFFTNIIKNKILTHDVQHSKTFSVVLTGLTSPNQYWTEQVK
jgi:hypothetical protein